MQLDFTPKIFQWLQALCFALLITSVVDCSAQIISFNHVTQANGLRNGNVRAIIRDYQGFMWFGTEDGLHRYDGSSMKIYRKDETDSSSISSNFILCLFEDSNKNLWVGTLDGGLCAYDREKDKFIRFNYHDGTTGEKIDDAVRCLHETSQKELFVGGGQLLRAKLTKNIKETMFAKVDLELDTVTSAGLRVMDINTYSDSLLLIGFNNLGFIIFNPHNNKYAQHPLSLIEKNIQSLYVDNARKIIWAGTWKTGVIVSDFSGQKYKRIQAGSEPTNIRNNYVPKITADHSGNLWIGTDDGLNMISAGSDPFESFVVKSYLPEPRNRSSISGSIIKSIYVDPDDNLWVGAYYSGISYYHKRSTHFGAVTLQDNTDDSNTGFRSVSALAEDARNTLWVGTDGAGLFLSSDSLDNAVPHFESIKSCDGISKIKTIKLDEAGNLWIGTWGRGLFRFDTRARTCVNYESLQTKIDIGTEITSVETDAQNNIWIGTFDNGIFRFDPRTNVTTKLKGEGPAANYIDRINSIVRGRNQDVWIGREAGGLLRSEVRSNSYHVVTTTHIKASTTVTAIYPDGEEMLWIGCPGKGLVRLNLRDNSSKLFTEQDGLANSMIYSILEDNDDRLWMSTDAGVSIFIKSTNKFVNFTLANGLLTSQFNKASALFSQSGFLIFGNIKGANFIRPNGVSPDHADKRLVFTRFFVNNKEQFVGKQGSVLPSNILVTQRIELDHNQNSFAVEVASLSYDLSHQPEYYYQLKNFNDTWQYGGTQSLIQYTNLEPGNYQLLVSTAPDANSEGNVVATLDVLIHPAWWQTFPFRIFLIALLISSAAGIHRFRIRYLLRQKAHLEDQVSQRTLSLNHANDLLQSKLNEIHTINQILKTQQNEIIEKNYEIQAQNEELTSQNEQIAVQHEKLIHTQEQLKLINQNLERVVNDRTQTLQKTIDNLNKIVFELDRFVYSASHDLSAPLKSILGLVQIINLETDRTKIVQYANLIRVSVQKLEDVIKSMVDYSRNAHLEVELRPCNISELVQEVFSGLAFLPEAEDVQLENLVPPQTIVHNDTLRVKMVLNNIIANAIKYIDRQKERKWVKVESFRNGEGISVRITDNGIGIHPEFIDKIFNMYFRATEVSRGSGLGLFIVKETISKIGGTISVQSTIGEGSVFLISIPDLRNPNK